MKPCFLSNVMDWSPVLGGEKSIDSNVVGNRVRPQLDTKEESNKINTTFIKWQSVPGEISSDLYRVLQCDI